MKTFYNSGYKKEEPGCVQLCDVGRMQNPNAVLDCLRIT